MVPAPAVAVAVPTEPPVPVTPAGASDRREPWPPVGPAWFGSVMGTAILATVLRTHPVLRPVSGGVAIALLVLAWSTLLGLTAAMIIFARRRPGSWSAGLRGAGAASWGMVSMGVLATGAAGVAVAPAIGPGWADLFGRIDVITWVIGTVIGAVTACGFTAWLITGDRGRPSTTWGLAVVPPMVSATTGAALAGRIVDDGAHLIMVLVSGGCFVAGLVLGGLVFAVAYAHHRRIRLPVAAAATAWIPLGIVGQSAAAAQVIAEQAGRILTPDAAGALDRLAVGHGVIMMIVAVPVVGWALRHTVAGVRARIAYTPGWWALTFPIGTLSLGAYHLGRRAGWPVVEWIGTGWCLVLAATWTWCAVATVAAVSRRVRGGRRVAG